MRRRRHCFQSFDLIAVAITVLWLLQSANVFAEDTIVLPNPKMFGKQIGNVPPLIAPNRDKTPIFPENIHFDLNGPVVYGVMATYPEAVSFQELVDAVNRKHKKWTRDPDGEMAKWGVTVWRNEDDRYSIQVSDSQVVMIWLDREITQREVNAVTKILFDDAMKRAL